MKRVSLTALGVTIVFGSLFAVSANIVRGETQDSSSEDVEQLRGEYEQIVEQASEAEDRKNALQEQVNMFNSRIQNLQEDITQTNAKLQKVKKDLAGAKQKITRLQEEIDLQKRFIERYIATLHSQSDVSLMRVFLSNENLSEMVGSIENVSSIQNSLRETIRDIERKQKEVRRAKKTVFEKERKLENTKRTLQQKKNLQENNKRRKKDLLEKTTKKLRTYREKESDLAAKINAITGIEGESVSIKEAYEVAERVSSQLKGKISPAYLVAVMMVESGTGSSVGANFGNSYYKDALSRCVQREDNATGFTVSDARKQENAFERILSNLDYSASNKYVSSCPVPSYSGMGGAMGYGQFLPATWIGWTPHVKALKSSDSFPNPWNLEDSALAIAVKLTNAAPKGKQGQSTPITKENVVNVADDLTNNKGLRRQRALRYLGSSSHGWYANHVKSSMNQVKSLMKTEETDEKEDTSDSEE